MISWEGIKAGDIFDGKVRRPPEAKGFYVALLDAETGAAQGANLEWDTDEVKAIDLGEGEVLRLPPTPDQLSEWEAQGIKDEEDVKFEESERQAVRALPPPPVHPRSKARSRPGSSASSIRSGYFSGTNSPEMQAHDPQSHLTSPLSRGLLSPNTAMSPPPPLPRRYSEEKKGLGLSNAESLDTDAVNADDSLDLHHLSLNEGTSRTNESYESASFSHDYNEGTLRVLTPPPTFEDATDSSPLSQERASHEPVETESFLIPPLLHHQDSTSSVSVYSDAVIDEPERSNTEEPGMSNVSLEDNATHDPEHPHKST